MDEAVTFVSSGTVALVVAADAELKIAAGSKLHFHKNAGLTVKGKITAIGNNDSIIEFRGGRTDNLFDDLPYDQISDQWQGIHLTTESFGNNFEFCDIRNGRYGIKADSSNVEELKIAVLSSKIQNTTGHLLELNNCYTTFGNSLIVNAGGNCININGGRHNFTFCTIANFYLWGSRSESVAITNKGNKHPYPLQNAEFTNCIITGTSRNEITTSLSDSINGDTIAVADYKISHSLVLTSDTTNKAFEKCVFDNPENPTIIEEFIRALGAEPVVYPYRNECCGGYISLKEPQMAKNMSANIAESAESFGAEMLITACPLCRYNLNKTANGLPVYYFTELLAESLGVKEA